MATQASAITFLSTPGMGFDSGLRFVQFYFGLPIAMLIVAYGFVPLFHRLKVYTAYEFLENRFDLNTRFFTAALFLLQRGLAAGITIYAPSIILSAILGWPLNFNILLIGTLVILYTVSGGTKAVTQTHKQQMAVIFAGLFVAFVILMYQIHEQIPLGRAWDAANWSGKLKSIDWKFDIEDRYNVWSGVLGGTFLMLSYFGTDQSQVQRYLGGKSVREIRTGLFFNAVLKIPMQYFILFTGVMVFVFYQLEKPPVYFDDSVSIQLRENNPELWESSQQKFNENWQQKKEALINGDKAAYAQRVAAERNIRLGIAERAREEGAVVKVRETDFVFIRFVLDYLPVGVVGLLLAMIFSAAMSSTAAELNALATTSVIDFYKRIRKHEIDDHHDLRVSKAFTAFWGVLAILFAMAASMFDNLVEYVNILGSLFYGTILGIFLVAFYVKIVKGRAVLIAGIITEVFIIILYVFQEEVNALIGYNIAFLWYNLIACVMLVLFALIVQKFVNKKDFNDDHMLDLPDFG
jgi:Na+/proline symporter